MAKPMLSKEEVLLDAYSISPEAAAALEYALSQVADQSPGYMSALLTVMDVISHINNDVRMINLLTFGDRVDEKTSQMLNDIRLVMSVMDGLLLIQAGRQLPAINVSVQTLHTIYNRPSDHPWLLARLDLIKEGRNNGKMPQK